jgi:hypothetical protein
MSQIFEGDIRELRSDVGIIKTAIGRIDATLAHVPTNAELLNTIDSCIRRAFESHRDNYCSNFEHKQKSDTSSNNVDFIKLAKYVGIVIGAALAGAGSFWGIAGN